MGCNGERRGTAARTAANQKHASDSQDRSVLRRLLRGLLVWWLVGLIRALELLDGEDGGDADMARMLLVDALTVLADPWHESGG